MVNDQDILTAFDEIERSLQGRMGAMEAAETVNKDNLCDTYQHVRPWLEAVLPVIEKISSRLSSILRLLMRIADSTCTVQTEHSIS